MRRSVTEIFGFPRGDDRDSVCVSDTNLHSRVPATVAAVAAMRAPECRPACRMTWVFLVPTHLSRFRGRKERIAMRDPKKTAATKTFQIRPLEPRIAPSSANFPPGQFPAGNAAKAPSNSNPNTCEPNSGGIRLARSPGRERLR
jgi:hypothetical protein